MTFQNLYELYMEDMAARLKQSTILTKKHIYETHILPFFGANQSMRLRLRMYAGGRIS